MPEKRRSYVILRDDGLVIHTKPITWEEAWWLYQYAYSAKFLDRRARARYLSEYGNVMDAGEYLKRLKILHAGLYYIILGLYGGPDRFAEKVGRLLERGDVSPGARQTLEELLDRVEEFLRKSVEPRPLGPRPVRYFEMSHRHITLGPDGTLREADPKPEWYACKEFCCELYHGVSVFPESFWLWFQSANTYVVVVRRDISNGDVVAAVASDTAVQGFLRENADAFRELLRENEVELASRGYGDVVRKAKVVLTTPDLLDAGRREEEALPA